MSENTNAIETEILEEPNEEQVKAYLATLESSKNYKTFMTTIFNEAAQECGYRPTETMVRFAEKLQNLYQVKEGFHSELKQEIGDKKTKKNEPQNDLEPDR